MATCFDVESDVVFARKVDRGLDLLGCCCVHNIHWIPFFAARISIVRKTAVVVPIVVCVTDRIIFVERPGFRPCSYDGRTVGRVVIWLSRLANSAGRRRLEKCSEH